VLDLDGLLRFAVEQGASDVHLKVGSRPRLRVDGRLREGPFDTVEPTDTDRLAAAVIPRARAERFAAENECDFMYGIAGLGRFRVSAFRQRGYVGLVLRRVLPGIPNPKYEPIKVITFHTRTTAKFYGDDYAVEVPVDS